MSRFVLLLCALISIPTLAFAQQASPGTGQLQREGDGPGPDPAAFGRLREQAQRIRAQARTQMLSALTPGHRSLLASIAGSLAIAATPDVDAAARQLDAALTPNEAQSIVAAAATMRSQQRAAFTAVAGRPEAPPPSNDATPTAPPESPGRALLRVTVGFGPGAMPRPEMRP